MPGRELEQTVLAGQVGGPLGAEVGEALLGIAHLAGETSELAIVSPGGRDHDPLLVEPGGADRHPRGGGAPHIGVVRPAGREAEQLAGGEDRGDQGDVGQVGAALEGVVEDPHIARGLLAVEHGRHGVGHGPQVNGDVLGLHDELAGGVEERRGAVAPLLDVRRVRGPDEDRAHLLAGRP